MKFFDDPDFEDSAPRRDALARRAEIGDVIAELRLAAERVALLEEEREGALALLDNHGVEIGELSLFTRVEAALDERVLLARQVSAYQDTLDAARRSFLDERALCAGLLSEALDALRANGSRRSDDLAARIETLLKSEITFGKDVVVC